MTRTAATVAQMRAQATRDEQWRRTLIGLLDVQRGERNSQLALRRFGQIALLVGTSIFVGLYLFEGISALIAWNQSGHLQSSLGSSSYQVFMFPMLLFILGPALYFPHRYFYASVDTLLHYAATGDDWLPPLAAPQPTIRSVAELPANGEQIGPLPRWNSKALTNSTGIVVVMAFFMGGFLALMGLLLGVSSLLFLTPALNGAEVALSVTFLVVALILVGGGIFLGVAGWRASRRQAGLRRDLAVTASADGLAWADPAWRTRQRMRLAWRDVRSFSVATYQREAGANKWQAYILDGGQTRLLWALPFDPSAEQSAVHERLAGLIVGATGLPLRDLTPGIVALGAAIRSANPLLQAKAEKAFAATQPAISGVPVRAMRRWAYGFYAVLAVSLVVTLAYGALAIVAQFVH